MTFNEMTDRELDALVAEKVIGIPWRKPTHGPCCTCQDCGHYYDDCQCGYATEILMAVAVVEKMISLGYEISLGNDNEGWYAVFTCNKKPDWTWQFGNDSPTRAICLAALAALEGAR